MNNNVKTINSFDYEGVKYILVQPSVLIMREATLRHRRAFTQALKEGFFTKRKLEAVLQEGPVNVMKEYIDRRAELLKIIHDTMDMVSKTDDPNQLFMIGETLSVYRQELMKEDMSINSLFANTAEQLAEDDRINYLCANLIRKEDTTKVWSSYDDYENYEDFNFVERCKYQVLCWEYSLNPEWDQNMPENTAFIKAQSILAAKESTDSLSNESFKEKSKKSQKHKSVASKKKKKVES